MKNLTLYTPNQTAEILGISMYKLFNYLRDAGYWYFNNKRKIFLPYSKYCKPKKRGKKFEEEYFILREWIIDGKQIKIGMITERGLEMLKKANI